MSTLQIPFTIEVNTITFERLLRQFYKKSVQKTTPEVIFDFKAVEWCDTFQLSLLVLWISELLHNRKRVIFIPPSFTVLPVDEFLNPNEKLEKVKKRKAVYSYLVECLFIDFLQKNRFSTKTI